MKTTRPPASGIHAKYRTLDTPGPLGWNDHGDPCHWRRDGRSPGSLSINDHGLPLGKKIFLLPDEVDGEVARQINRVVDEVDAAVHPDAAAALRACLDASKPWAMSSSGARDDTGECVLAYFQARLMACEGHATVEGDADWPAAGQQMGYGLARSSTEGWVRFFSPPQWAAGGAPHASSSLSYERIGQLPPHSERTPVTNRSAHWAEEGHADGLRDRTTPKGKLRNHLGDSAAV